MRIDLIVCGRSLRSALTILVGGAAVAASCTFNPGPAGSVSPTGSTTGSTGSGLLGAGATSGGRGAAGSTGTSTGAGASTLRPDGMNCGLQSYGLQNVPPDLLIVLDKSGSMANQPDDTSCPRGGGACETKWADMTTGINMVVGQTQAQIRWGLKFFADEGTCGVTAGAAVPVAPNNGMAIATAIGGTRPSSSTPTRIAVASAATYLMGLADANPKYILLATDGEPNCIPGDRKTDDDDSMGAAASVAMAAMAGFPVFVVGVGNVAPAVDTLKQFDLSC